MQNLRVEREQRQWPDVVASIVIKAYFLNDDASPMEGVVIMIQPSPMGQLHCIGCSQAYSAAGGRLVFNGTRLWCSSHHLYPFLLIDLFSSPLLWLRTAPCYHLLKQALTYLFFFCTLTYSHLSSV